MHEFNSYVDSERAINITFHGAMAKRLSNYSLPTFIDDKPELVVIDARCNDLEKSRGKALNQTINEVADDIINIEGNAWNTGQTKYLFRALFAKKKILRSRN